MKKLCLILLFLNAAFTAQDLEDSVPLLSKRAIKKQEDILDYGIYRKYALNIFYKRN